MSKSITLPFKIPVPKAFLKRVANFFNIEIIEKVTGTKEPNTKMSTKTYFHTIPQQTIDTWSSERHNKDGVETIKNNIGFHLKKNGRSGTIYYVDNSKKVCEFYYEISGVAIYDILIAESQLSEWFLPTKEKLSTVEKDKIIAEMKTWLAESNIKASFY